jgi:hypothetical protein
MSTAIGEEDTAVTEAVTSDATDIEVFIARTRKMQKRHHCLVVCLIVSVITETPIFQVTAIITEPKRASQTLQMFKCAKN